MQDARLYPNAATASANNAEFSAAPNNSLENLLPEHLNMISSEWLANLVQWRFSGNQMRVLNAIFRHTIYFWKREDDMNGTRLQQITEIRYDHINHIVKKFAEQNVLILRKGFYGFWMSINFDFSTWGKKNIDIPADNNDPTRLLPETVRDIPDDNGKSLDDNHYSETPTSPVNQAISTKDSIPTPTPTIQETAPVPAPINNDQNINNNTDNQLLKDNFVGLLSEFSQEMMGEIDTQLSELAQKVKGFTQVNTKLDTLSDVEKKVHSLENIVKAQSESNQQNQIAKAELESIIQQQNEFIDKIQSDKSRDNAKLDARIQEYRQADKAELEDFLKQQISLNQTKTVIETSPATDQFIDDHHIEYQHNNEAFEPVEYSDLSTESDAEYQRYCDQTIEKNDQVATKESKESLDFTQNIEERLYFPVKFPPDMCANIESIQTRFNLDIPTTQTLLDFTNQRRYIDPKEVYNPVGYFFELARNVKEGKLDIKEIEEQVSPPLPSRSKRRMADPIKVQCKLDHSLYYIRLQELKQDYDKAKQLYSHHEDYFSQAAEKASITFEQAIANENKQNFWDKIVNNLEVIHQDIEAYVQESPT